MEKEKKKKRHDRKPAPCGQRIRKGIVYKVINKTKKPQAFETYALAEKDRVDNKTNASRPSDSQVENMRDFSIENKK